jgi:hypothetical protein
MIGPVPEGKVAKIISTRELGINLGFAKGVEEGMIFAVLAETPLRIVDPDSGDLLGEVDREKVRVKATEVFEKFSICRTFETYETSGLGLALASIAATRRVRTLTIEDSELPPPLSEEESYVKVGDRVRQVPREE